MSLRGKPTEPLSKLEGDGQLGFVRNEVERQLALYRRRRRRDKRKAFTLQMATVCLSATITVLLGLRTAGDVRTWLLNIALVLGALVTVLAAAEAFFTHRRLWVLRTTTVRRLEGLARRLGFLAAGPESNSDQAALDRCLAELNRILSDDQKAWLHLRETPASTHADIPSHTNPDLSAMVTASIDSAAAGSEELTKKARGAVGHAESDCGDDEPLTT